MSHMNSYRATAIRNRMEQNSCRGKREYMSMQETSNAAEIVGRRIGEVLLAYQCRFCCLFHIGHPPSHKRIEAERTLKQYGYNIGHLQSATELDVSICCEK